MHALLLINTNEMQRYLISV